MSDKAASVLARLKNVAKSSRRTYSLCLQLFCQEEFLRRLSLSSFSNNLVLKGGLFLYALTDFDSRVTVDIDFLLRWQTNTEEHLRSMLDEIIGVNTGNTFISFTVLRIEPIAVVKPYPGIRATLIAHIKNTRTPFSIDFGVGDVIVPKSVKRSIPTQLPDFPAPILQTYSLETTIAEKLDAILDLMDYSSRMKDYFDIYYLAGKFNFEGDTLIQAMKHTFANRHRAFTEEQFRQMLHFADNTAMQIKWNAFLRKLYLPEPDLETVLLLIRQFLKEPFMSVLKGKSFLKNWNAAKLQWE